MEYLYPDDYDRFVCIADACEDTCCAGWQIMIDEESLAKYKKEKGAFGNRLHNCINWKEKCFEVNEKRCAFLNEENLCDLYSELGPDALCHTCKTYPRHIEEYENIRENMLSLSCPEACRMILSKQEPITFLYKEDDDYEEYEDFDFLLFTKLEDTREWMCSVLQDRTMTMGVRLGICLAFAHDFQKRIQEGRLFDVDELLEKYQSHGSLSYLAGKMQKMKSSTKERRERLQQMFHDCLTLEALDSRWHEELREILTMIEHTECEKVLRKRQEFYDQHPEIEVQFEQIAVTLLYTYYCGAVYDEDVLTKIKFIVTSILIIEALYLASWIDEEKELDFAEQVRIVHKYSREIEHSDLNLDQFEKMIKTTHTYHYVALIEMLLS